MKTRKKRRFRPSILLPLLLLAALTACSAPARVFSFETRALTSTGEPFAQPSVGLVDRETLTGAPVPWNSGLLCLTFTQGDDPNLVFLDPDGSERRLPVHAAGFAASEDGVWFLAGSPGARCVRFLRAEDAEPEDTPVTAGDADTLRFSDGRLVWADSVPSADGGAARVRYCAYDPSSGKTETLAEAPALGGQNRRPSVQSGYLTFLDVDAGQYVLRAVPLRGGEARELCRTGLSDPPAYWAYDGRFLVWTSSVSAALRLCDTKTGEETVLREDASGGELRLLGGRYAVYFAQDGLCVLDLPSGEPVLQAADIPALDGLTFPSAFIGTGDDLDVLAFGLSGPDGQDYAGTLAMR